MRPLAPEGCPTLPGIDSFFPPLLTDRSSARPTGYAKGRAVMNSGKLWYWVAAGVLVMGLRADYRAGQAQWTQPLVEGAQTFAGNAHARAAQYLAVTELMLGARPLLAHAHARSSPAIFVVEAPPAVPIAVARQLSLPDVNLRRAVIQVGQSFAHRRQLRVVCRRNSDARALEAAISMASGQ
jgi:hypothetical protein